MEAVREYAAIPESSGNQIEAAAIRLATAAQPDQLIPHLYTLATEGYPAHALWLAAAVAGRGREAALAGADPLPACCELIFALRRESLASTAAVHGLVALARGMTETAMRTGRHSVPIRALQRAALQLADKADGPSTLTPIHPLFLRLCIYSRHYRFARAFIRRGVTRVQPGLAYSEAEGREKTALDTMLYFFYAGAVMCASKAWTEAADLLETAFTAPARKTSAIALAAYHRWALVSLIDKAAVPPLPVHTPSCLKHSITQLPGSDPHKRVVEACKRALDGGQQPPRVAVAEHETQLEAAGTLGLALQAAASHVRHRIARQAATYVALPMPSVASRSGLPRAEDVPRNVLALVRDGKANAHIDGAAGVVMFGDRERDSAGAPAGDAVAASQLLRELQGAAESADRVRALAEALERDPKVLGREAKRQQAPGDRTAFPQEREEEEEEEDDDDDDVLAPSPWAGPARLT